MDINNFPIVYAPLPIIKTWVDDDTGLKMKKVLCYITEKCYLISEIKKYGYKTISEIDGKVYEEKATQKTYEVVFFRRIDSNDIIREQQPDIYNDSVSNSNKVNFLSDSKDLCNEMTEYLNQNILNNLLNNNNNAFSQEKIKNNFYDCLNSYKVRLSLDEYEMGR